MIIDITVLTALTVGFVEALKIAGVPTKFAPIASLLFAIGLNFFATFVGQGTSEILIGGLTAGLIASGLYDNADKGRDIVVDGFNALRK